MLTRYRRHRVSLVCGLAVVACATSTLLAQQQDKLVFVPVRASEVMSPADQQRIGVDRLTPEQRFAFDVWLTRYSAELRASPLPQPSRGPRTIFASAADDGSAAESDAESTQRGARRQPDRLWTPLLGVPTAARLQSTPDDGSFVRLADGTLWEVYPPDRTSTDTWEPGDHVSVSLAPTAVGDFDHVLIDSNSNTRAHVRFVDVIRASRRR